MIGRKHSAIAVLLVSAGFSCSQLGPPAVPPGEQATQKPPLEFLAAAEIATETRQPSRLEKAREEVRETLQKAGETLREQVGLAKTGCLTLGDEADPYILTESASGEEMTVVGAVELAGYVDQTVRLHGRREADGRIFHATKVEPMAPSCEPAPTESSDSAPESRGGLTADDQGQGAADRKTTQEIRKAVVKDDSLSFQARNIKIITRNGFVTLKGRVSSEEEKRVIGKLAAGITDAGKVSNQLTTKRTLHSEK